MSDQYSSPPEPDKVKALAEANGFCLIKGVFSGEQMADLEAELARLSDIYSGSFPDLYSIPSLRWVMLNEKVLGIARALLGPHPVYYRETSIAFEKERGTLTYNPYNELHCDARGSPENIHDVWQERDTEIYPAYRYAVYMRDYSKHSGGLKVVPGSHLGPAVSYRRYHYPKYIRKLPKHEVVLPQGLGSFKAHQPPFAIYNVASEPGDVVVFNLRTYHSAGAVRFPGLLDLALLPMTEQALRPSAEAIGAFVPIPDGCRNAVFFDYAGSSAQADLYIKWRALWNSAATDSAITCDDAPVNGLELRNDRIMVALAKRLVEDASKANINLDTFPSMNVLPAPMAAMGRRLLSLCQSYRQFSEFHQLFDGGKFQSAMNHSEVEGLKVALHGIQAALDAVQKKHDSLMTN